MSDGPVDALSYVRAVRRRARVVRGWSWAAYFSIGLLWLAAAVLLAPGPDSPGSTATATSYSGGGGLSFSPGAFAPTAGIGVLWTVAIPLLFLLAGLYGRWTFRRLGLQIPHLRTFSVSVAVSAVAALGMHDLATNFTPPGVTQALGRGTLPMLAIILGLLVLALGERRASVWLATGMSAAVVGLLATYNVSNLLPLPALVDSAGRARDLAVAAVFLGIGSYLWLERRHVLNPRRYCSTFGEPLR